MTTPLIFLQAVRQRISNEHEWTKNWFAKDAEGEDILSTDPRAVCWCSIGATIVVGFQLKLDPEDEHGAWQQAYNYWEEAINGHNDSSNSEWISIAVYNDNHTHEEVLTMLDKAIKLAELDN